MPDRRAEAGGVRERAQRADQPGAWDAAQEAVLHADPGAGGPGSRGVPVHGAKGEHPGHQPQRAHRPLPPRQLLRQACPHRLPVPMIMHPFLP